MVHCVLVCFMKHVSLSENDGTLDQQLEACHSRGCRNDAHPFFFPSYGMHSLIIEGCQIFKVPQLVVVLGADPERPRFKSQFVQYFWASLFWSFLCLHVTPRIVFGFFFFFGLVYVCMLPPAVPLQLPSVTHQPLSVTHQPPSVTHQPPF